MPAIVLDISKALLEELSLATEQILKQYKLGSTDLMYSVDWQYKNDMFYLMANDYFQYVALGRKPMARKVPVEDLIKWMKKKGIAPRSNQTYNSLAFAIQRSIYLNGIKARDFITPVINTIQDIITEDIAESLSEEICNAITADIEKISIR